MRASNEWIEVQEVISDESNLPFNSRGSYYPDPLINYAEAGKI